MISSSVAGLPSTGTDAADDDVTDAAPPVVRAAQPNVGYVGEGNAAEVAEFAEFKLEQHFQHLTAFVWNSSRRD